MIENKVILIGNGINNIRNTYKWKNLIVDLINHVGVKEQINIDEKPFPLLYEEIFLKGAKSKGIKESQIKNFIAKKINRIQHNEIHEEILKCRFKNILTTNYDYNLEKSQGLKQEELKNTAVVKESKYSLFRCIKNSDSKIWHIHGECNFPRTITLGYEQYSGYLQHMRNYVVTGTGNSYRKTFKSFKNRLRIGDISFDSWVDFFFTKNIFIIGLTLDFVEIHLWWLLTFRARGKYTNNIKVSNKIIYFYPDTIDTNIINKLELLKSNDVIPYSIKSRSVLNSDYYFEILNKVRNF